jgi:hypothetical protein
LFLGWNGFHPLALTVQAKQKESEGAACFEQLNAEREQVKAHAFQG